MMSKKINLTEAFASFDEHWSPRVAGEMNGQQVKLAKLKGEFIWHKHDDEDEIFLVVKGSFILRLRDGDIHLKEGEFYIVPKGVEHLPIAEEECHVILIEPGSIRNTGEHENDRTFVPVALK